MGSKTFGVSSEAHSISSPLELKISSVTMYNVHVSLTFLDIANTSKVKLSNRDLAFSFLDKK